MDVLVAPFFEGNQYLERVRAELSSRGVTVQTEGKGVPFAPFFHRLGGVDVFHLHWTHPYFLFGSKEWAYHLPFSKTICRLAAVAFLLQMYLARVFCDRVVWTVHNVCNHERRYVDLDRWVSRRLVSVVDAIQVWDERTENEFRSFVGTELPEIRQIPHGNYCAEYERVDRETARDRLGIEPDARVFLYFGIIRRYKGVPELIRAFDSLDGATLVVAGNPKDPDLEREIRALASDRDDVRLVFEYISDSEVPTYFGAADVAVFPYRHIFNSGSVVLAMSLATPVVAPRRGSIPSVLPPGNFVYESLEAALREANDAERERLTEVGEANLDVARSTHDWDEVAKRYLNLYRGASREVR